jgi:hypothetical protein
MAPVFGWLLIVGGGILWVGLILYGWGFRRVRASVTGGMFSGLANDPYYTAAIRFTLGGIDYNVVAGPVSSCMPASGTTVVVLARLEKRVYHSAGLRDTRPVMRKTELLRTAALLTGLWLVFGDTLKETYALNTIIVGAVSAACVAAYLLLQRVADRIRYKRYSSRPAEGQMSQIIGNPNMMVSPGEAVGCPICDNPIHPEALTCIGCGSSWYTCPECGRDWTRGARKCRSCGHRLASPSPRTTDE